jgi:hypothetical protein
MCLLLEIPNAVAPETDVFTGITVKDMLRRTYPLRQLLSLTGQAFEQLPSIKRMGRNSVLLLNPAIENIIGACLFEGLDHKYTIARIEGSIRSEGIRASEDLKQVGSLEFVYLLG